jgi:hypothetical protein
VVSEKCPTCVTAHPEPHPRIPHLWRCDDCKEHLDVAAPVLLTPTEVRVISDALDYWRDKDRHGELEREYGYDRAKCDALSTASTKVDDEAKRRGVYWT